MGSVIQNKIVRDGILDRIRRDGKEPIWEIATPPEARRLMLKKVIEESSELAAANSAGMADELADLIEAAYACGEVHGISRDMVEERRLMKLETHGGFSKLIKLIAIDDR